MLPWTLHARISAYLPDAPDRARHRATCGAACEGHAHAARQQEIGYGTVSEGAAVAIGGMRPSMVIIMSDDSSPTQRDSVKDVRPASPEPVSSQLSWSDALLTVAVGANCDAIRNLAHVSVPAAELTRSLVTRCEASLDVFDSPISSSARHSGSDVNVLDVFHEACPARKVRVRSLTLPSVSWATALLHATHVHLDTDESLIAGTYGGRVPAGSWISTASLGDERLRVRMEANAWIGGQRLTWNEIQVFDMGRRVFPALERLDLSFLSSSMIERINLTSLRNARFISPYALNSCEHLTVIDFGPEVWANLRFISAHMLEGCSALVQIRNLSALRHVQSIQSIFCRLRSLPTIDFGPEPWAALERIGVREGNTCFLGDCPSLSSVGNLHALRSVHHLGNGLFRGSALTEIDFGDAMWSCLGAIRNEFCFACRSLVRVVSLASLRNVVSIGDDFFARCESLQELDFGEDRWEKLDTIGTSFLADDEALIAVHGLASLNRVSEVGRLFMSCCAELQSIDFGDDRWDQLRGIPDFSLDNCTSLQVVRNLASLNSVRRIGDGFLSYSTAMAELDFGVAPWANLRDVGDDFLEGAHDAGVGIVNISSLGEHAATAESTGAMVDF